MKTKVILTLLLSSILIHCAPPSPDDFDSDKALFARGKELYERKQYSSASEHFESLNNRFPQSTYYAESNLLLANSHFEAGEYLEAEFEYQSFLKRYPENIHVPEALLNLGKTQQLRARKAPERDQTHSKNAIYHYTQLIQQHPNTKEAKEATELSKKLRKRLVSKNLYIANFYMKQKEYGAAIPRLMEIHANYEFEDLQQEASYFLAKAYSKLDRTEESQKYVMQILKQKDFGFHNKAKRLKK